MVIGSEVPTLDGQHTVNQPFTDLPPLSVMKLEGIPDVTRFIRRTDKVPINNTVTLILGEVEIEANRLVLALKSKVIEEIVSTQREIFLDDFVGEEEGVQDVLEMLYGGDVKVSMANIKTIIKFSVLYNIRILQRLL